MEPRPRQRPGVQGAVLAALCFLSPCGAVGPQCPPEVWGAMLSTSWPRARHSRSVLVKGRGQAVPSGRARVIYGPSLLPQVSAGSWGASAATS